MGVVVAAGIRSSGVGQRRRNIEGDKQIVCKVPNATLQPPRKVRCDFLSASKAARVDRLYAFAQQSRFVDVEIVDAVSLTPYYVVS